MRIFVSALLLFFFVSPCHGMNKTKDGPHFELVVRSLDIAQRESYKSPELDWSSLRNDVIMRYGASSNKSEAYSAIELLLKSINDDHSFLSVNGARFNKDNSIKVLHNNVEQIAIHSSLSKEKIAYIHIPKTIGNDIPAINKYAKSLYAEIAKYSDEDLSAFILDFRHNSGGQLWPMLAGLSALINSDNAGTGVFVDGPHWNWWAKSGEAGTKGKNFKNTNHSISDKSLVNFDDDLPIAVLISDVTGSSGEASVISFIGRNNTCIIGQRTRAQATINQPFNLDETTKLFIARGYFGNRDGGVYPKGISPQIIVHKDKDPKSIEIARHWITGKRSCE